jgi:segregation and condensation protein B
VRFEELAVSTGQVGESGARDQDAPVDSGAEADADSRSEAPSADGDADGDAGAEVIGHDELKRIVESLIFVADKPIPLGRLRELTEVSDLERLRAICDELVAEYEDRGILLDDVAGGYQFHTSPTTASYVQKLVEGRPVRLSRAQLETLAIVAYRQPITRPEIDEIRGVDSANTLKVLLERSLIRVLGKREEPGRPWLYGTTKDFLEFFNLSEISSLPTLREYHELTEDSMRQVERLSAELGQRDPGRAPGPSEADDADSEAAPDTHTDAASGAEDAAGAEPDFEPPEPDPQEETT